MSKPGRTTKHSEKTQIELQNTNDSIFSPKKIKELLGHVKGLEGELGVVIGKMEEKVRLLERLRDFSAILNSTLDPEKVREKALEATCELLGCETASLYLIDHKKQELYWETALGEEGKKLKESVRLPINNESIAGHVAGTGKQLMINDVEKDPRYFSKAKEKSGFQTRTMLCIPLFTKGKTIGVLQALNKTYENGNEFTEDDLKLFVSLGHQVAIAVENSQLYMKLKKSFFGTVSALAEAIEKKDKYTGGHTKRVVHFSVCIAKYLDLSNEQIEQIRLAAILHDVGKIGIEDKILKKPAELDPYEWPVMRTHPDIGYEIMKNVEGMGAVIDGMRYHHERWDGKGYPHKLAGTEIPLVARIISVADTYDAMVSNRPYKKGLSPQVAFDEIVRCSGTQFCPNVVEAFKKAYANEKMGQQAIKSRQAS